MSKLSDPVNKGVLVGNSSRLRFAGRETSCDFLFEEVASSKTPGTLSTSAKRSVCASTLIYDKWKKNHTLIADKIFPKDSSLRISTTRYFVAILRPEISCITGEKKVIEEQ